MIIRSAKLEDIESIVSLSQELGYDPSFEGIKNKIIKFSSNEDQEIYVAEINEVVGWIHISLVEPLESNAFVELRGIVVNKDHRRKGIGTELIKIAGKWGIEKGFCRIRIRTNIKRLETREYYSRYSLTHPRINLGSIVMAPEEPPKKAAP